MALTRLDEEVIQRLNELKALDNTLATECNKKIAAIKAGNNAYQGGK